MRQIAFDSAASRPHSAAPRFSPAPTLRLLHVCDSLTIGGAERHVIALAAGLRRRGHDVTVVCSATGDLFGEALEAGVAVHPIGETPVKRRVSVRYSRALTRLLGAARFDVVHAHMHASSAAAAIACAQAGVPLVITEHSEGAWRDARAWRTSRTAYRRAAHVIAVSERIAQRLIEEDRLTSERVTTIANALWRRATPRAPFLRSLVSGGPVVGVVARLAPEKGIGHFVRAAAAVARELPRATFVVIGDGPLRGELATLATDVGIASRVHFLGARPDGPELIGELDVLVVPSLSEGTPLVTLEALSAGVALVASAVGGIPDQVAMFPGTALVRPGDEPALARAIVAMARTRSAHAVSSGRLPISLLPGHEAMVRRTESVYAAVLAASRRRARARERITRQLWPVH